MNEPASSTTLVKDTNSLLRTIRLQDSNPLFHRVLTLYKHRLLPNHKSEDFFSNLKCFLPIDSTFEPGSTNISYERTRQARPNKTLLELCSAPEQYVAVSYPWKASDGEAKRKGGYLIAPNFSRVNVRDIVLDRSIRFIKYMERDSNMIPFWIDQLSINQRNGRKKEEAIQSMDLVYKRCKCGFQTPITVSILRDLSCRRIGNPFNLLAITANVCGYDNRFSTAKKRSTEKS